MYVQVRALIWPRAIYLATARRPAYPDEAGRNTEAPTFQRAGYFRVALGQSSENRDVGVQVLAHGLAQNNPAVYIG